jgi:hypothetical protein
MSVPTRARLALSAVPFALLLALAGAARAAGPAIGPEIKIARAAGPITIDGDLSDPGWQGATRVDTWYETNPGDNVPPPVKNVAYLTFDDKYLYAGFEFEDPHPELIRAPFGDRDNVPSYTDYAGIIIDPRHDGRTGLLLLANPNGIQYDAVSDDTNGNEDSSPDFFWDSVGRVTKTGWTLEMRVPFSSLRYPKAPVQTWGILLYRNHPREFRRQYFSARLPRDENCFICHSNPLSGLEGLPSGGHLVVAPYGTAKEEGVPRRGLLGNELVNKPVNVKAGVDAKWTPNENTALDATFNPDFSQVESDVAQISANERFALFYPEKRPFFLEGIELFSTPIQAVYTRTITSPRWGVRATGKFDTTGYTALVASDRGGGSVILPGPNGSDFADQEFKSTVAIGRLRHELGRSFVSVLATDREVSGGGHNRVVGPDFQWRPTASDSLTGQLLFSSTRTPERPDLAAEWDGRSFTSHAADVWFSHNTTKWDVYDEYKDFGNGFRADDGFVPQVGFRENYFETGWTLRPTGAFTRVRTSAIVDYQAEQDGPLINRSFSFAAGADGFWSSFTRLRFASERIRAGATTIARNLLFYALQFSPSRTISQIVLQGDVGQQIDFANARPGHGARVNLRVVLRPTSHLELRGDGERRWLNVKPDTGGEDRRLFVAQFARLKATYTFSARSFLRLIGQYVWTTRDPSLYRDAVNAKDGDFSASALFAYKLNWQTLLFLGYGDNRTLQDEHLEKADRQLFLKVSYAFQK